MPSELEPNIDVYGSKARRSAIADFVELWALHGQHPTAAALGDYVRDNGWMRKWGEAYTAAPAPSDDEDVLEDALEAGDDVFAILDERAELLGARYPFQREGQRLTFSGAGDEPYVGLLCLTLAHAYRLVVSTPPTSVFEDVVAQVVQNRVDRAVNFGRIRRDHPDFPSALLAIGRPLLLEPTPAAAPHAIRAVDEHVDIVGHLDWGDSRIGKWSLVGQATCGSSDTWVGKMAEVPVGAWTSYLNTVIDPLALLAVPHHVEAGHFAYLVTGHRRLLLDRARLARWLDDPVEGLSALVTALLDQAVVGAP